MAVSSNRLFGALLLTLALSAGCAKPSGNYFFVSAETARSQYDRYDFTLPLDDSTCTCTVRLAARLVASRLPKGQLPLEIRTTSPIGESSIERLNFAIDGTAGSRLTKGSGSVIDCEWVLQENFRISGNETGTWQVSVTPTDKNTTAAIRGIGLSYEY